MYLAEIHLCPPTPAAVPLSFHAIVGDLLIVCIRM
eukprot:CAMPEP_0168392998 /NCGR_PEP_ID=MMETSP0228-20121227/18789_1 /TAXON_ID=133427 /ORGANISM="Protoceratium reticulatum, Strain CCCM 535 (=CCMP 1889)" /LENGTH=34 /DNA_ID= /DNA_START= /DNA_END= /DNA_ORIENTATION=